MNATRNTEWLLLTTSVSLAGAIAQAPVISLAATLAALIGVGAWKRPRLVLAVGTLPVKRPADARESTPGLVFRGFLGGESSSAPISDEEEGEDNEAHAGSQAYEEFAANLEDEEDEEILFMPHYASDVEPASAVEDEAGDAEATDSLLIADLQEVAELVSKLPVSRRFALGTVAIIRRLLEPTQVEQILMEQRRYPRLRFGDLAVQLELLTEPEVQELLVAQEEGVFSDEEISDARRRLSLYHSGG